MQDSDAFYGPRLAARPADGSQRNGEITRAVGVGRDPQERLREARRDKRRDGGEHGRRIGALEGDASADEAPDAQHGSGKNLRPRGPSGVPADFEPSCRRRHLGHSCARGREYTNQGGCQPNAGWTREPRQGLADRQRGGRGAHAQETKPRAYEERGDPVLGRRRREAIEAPSAAICALEAAGQIGVGHGLLVGEPQEIDLDRHEGETARPCQRLVGQRPRQELRVPARPRRPQDAHDGAVEARIREIQDRVVAAPRLPEDARARRDQGAALCREAPAPERLEKCPEIARDRLDMVRRVPQLVVRGAAREAGRDRRAAEGHDLAALPLRREHGSRARDASPEDGDPGHRSSSWCRPISARSDAMARAS